MAALVSMQTATPLTLTTRSQRIAGEKGEEDSAGTTVLLRSEAVGGGFWQLQKQVADAGVADSRFGCRWW